MYDIFNQFLEGLQQTTVLEFLAVFFGIASVWLSKKENILVYPVGLINTVSYVYLSFKYQLFGEAAVNLYYTVVSLYGWYIWARKDESQQPLVHITYSGKKEWLHQIIFFGVFYLIIFACLTYLKKAFAPGALPAADAFASATAFTGMWLMARKKVESWYWWIATNIASIPLYFVKGLVFTSFYYFILLILAILGAREWSVKARRYAEKSSHSGSRVNG